MVWNNIYFVRFRSGVKYVLLNSIINHIPSWTIRRVLYRLMGIKLGKKCRIGLYTIIDYPKGITIGNESVINENCFLDGRGGLIINDNVSISIYTKIITASHKLNNDKFEYFQEKVIIECNVWTGVGAIILNGSRIKKGAVIGAGCVFKGEAEEYSVYIGNPAKKIKNREQNGLYQLHYRPWLR